jgi:hypothetical protein
MRRKREGRREEERRVDRTRISSVTHLKRHVERGRRTREGRGRRGREEEKRG